MISLDTEIGQTDDMIEERFGRHRHAEIIMSLPGFGVTLGAELLAATGGDMSAFDSVDHLAGVARLAPCRAIPGESAVTSNAPAATTDGYSGPATHRHARTSDPMSLSAPTTTANAPKAKLTSNP